MVHKFLQYNLDSYTASVFQIYQTATFKPW